MATGDDIEAGSIAEANDTTVLNAATKTENEFGVLGGLTKTIDFRGRVIFQVGPHLNPFFAPEHDLNGILGLGQGASGVGVEGRGGRVGVTGRVSKSKAPIPQPLETAGVLGTSFGNKLSAGVIGESDAGYGVFGTTDDGTGVRGESRKVGVEGVGETGVQGLGAGDAGARGVLGSADTGTGVLGTSVLGVGVSGTSRSGAGVRGNSSIDDGVAGFSAGKNKSGVFGFNSKKEGVAFGVVGRCDSSRGVGVSGGNSSIGGTGVLGTCDGEAGTGVLGNCDKFGGVGVRAQTAQGGIALVAEDKDGSGLAGFFAGDVRVLGNHIVFGSKSAAVRHPDGSHRLLYCMESPESWFEDFGEARLVDGKAEVRLDPDFVVVIKSNRYHVFVTPYGNSNGLFVTHRNSKGFRVQEQNDGKSNLTFSYRVVAKRKAIKAERLASITFPEHSISKVAKEPRKPVVKRRSKQR